MKTLDEAVIAVLGSSHTNDAREVSARVRDQLSRYPFLTELISNPRAREAVESLTYTMLLLLQGVRVLPTTEGEFVGVHDPTINLEFEFTNLIVSCINTGLMIGIEMEKAEVE